MSHSKVCRELRRRQRIREMANARVALRELALRLERRSMRQRFRRLFCGGSP